MAELCSPKISNERNRESRYPPLSVVIVSWNAKDFLAECLLSLFQHDYPGLLEVVVVDNGSEDGSVELVEMQYPHVKMISNGENLGFAKANNIGIRQCCGKYIALINSDVHVLPECLSNLVNYCESHPRSGLVGPYIFGADGEQQISFRATPSLWSVLSRALALDVVISRAADYWRRNSLRHAKTAPTSVDILSGCFWLVSRRAIEEVGLLDELFFIYGEDMDWCKRFSDAGWAVDFVEDAKAIHYGGASSANSPIRFSVEMQKSDYQYWRKHQSRYVVYGYRAISLLHHGLRIAGYSLLACIVDRSRGNVFCFKVQRSIACVRWLISGREYV